MFRTKYPYRFWVVVLILGAMAFAAAMTPAKAQGTEQPQQADDPGPALAIPHYYVANPQDGTLVPIVPAPGQQAKSGQPGTMVPLVPMQRGRPGLLAPEQVTLKRLHQVFQSAYLEATIDSDDDEIMIVEEGVKTIVRLDPERQMIHFASLWQLDPNVPYSDKLELVNRWNRELTVVKFWLLDEGILVTEYDAFYKEGVTPGQVINVYRWFYRVTTGAISRHDPDNVVGVRTSGSLPGEATGAGSSARQPKAA